MQLVATHEAGRGPSEAARLSVCMVITDMDAPTGGAQNQARALAAELQARGHTVFVLTRNYHRRPAHEIRNGVEYRRWPVLGRRRAANSLLFLLGAVGWLIRNQTRYDVVHGYQAYAPATIGVLAGLVTRRPVLIKVTASNDYGEAQEIRRLPFTGLRRRLLRRVHRFVVLTPQMAREFLALGIRAERIVPIPNGVRIPPVAAYEPGVREAARLRLELPQGKIAIYTGRLSAEKGLDTLLYAWRAVLDSEPDAHLLLVGEGTAYRNVEPELRTLAVRLGIDRRVRFTGRVDNVGEYLQGADVFVLGSISEGMSNSLLEAMAAGVAIAASDMDANAAVLRDGEHALLFAPGDCAGNARALLQLLGDPVLRERLGRAARARAIAEFALPRVTDRYVHLYKELLAEGDSS